MTGPDLPTGGGEPLAPAGSHLTQRVVRGARWVAVSRFVNMATTWASTVALAHFLAPAEYGVAGMALIVVAIFTVFQDSGLHAALIQRRDRVQEAVDTAAAYAPLVGVFLLVACVVGAPLVGGFFHRSQVTDLVRALGVVFLLRALSQVPGALLQKELLFGRLTAVSLSGNLLQAATVIALAATGAGPWAVIVGQIVAEGWTAALLWPLCPYRPHPSRATRRALRELLGYGRHMVAANVSGFVNSYVSVTVVGRLLGAAELGSYTLGYQTGKQAVAAVTYSLNQVIFPAYSKLQDDLPRFRRAYLRSLRFVCVISMPAGFGLAAVSGVFVHAIYGARWSPAGPVLAIVALIGVVLSVTATMGEVLKATAKPHLFFRASLVQTILVVAAVLSLYRFGITAVAAGQAAAVTITGVVVTRFVSRILSLDLATWVRTILPSATAAAIMAGVVLLTRVALRGSLPDGAALALLVVEGAAAYGLALRLVAREQLREFLAELERLSALGSLRRRLARGGAGPLLGPADPDPNG